MCLRVYRDTIITEATMKLCFCGIFHKVGLKGSAVGVVLMFLLFIESVVEVLVAGDLSKTKAYSVLISRYMSIRSNIIQIT